MDGALVIFVVVTMIVADTFFMIFLFTCVLGLIACVRELPTDTREMIVRAAGIPCTDVSAPATGAVKGAVTRAAANRVTVPGALPF